MYLSALLKIAHTRTYGWDALVRSKGLCVATRFALNDNSLVRY